jgi:histidyl-tRNA synthetase
MNKANLQPLKGFRDFYPEQMKFRNFLFGQIRKISQLFGYEEYEGPTLEPVEIYTAKTDEELIKNQTFILKDKNDNNLAMRPELTPTLARMVAAKQNELNFPLRWFSIGPRWRYEQPQKGRFREFWQWDLDLIGENSLKADTEIIIIAAELLKSLGLSPDQVMIKINNRRFLEKQLKKVGLTKEKINLVYKITDKKDKMKEDEWEKYLKENIGQELAKKIKSILNKKSFSNFPELSELFALLKKTDIAQYVEFDSTIVRGLDYYTDMVFEARDVKNEFRTIIGGGRYDNLVSLLGGQKITGVGFAAGDAVLEEVLKKFNLLPNLKENKKILITVFNESLADKSFELSQKLRKDGIANELYLKLERIDKQIKYADKKGIKYVIILGPDEIKDKKVTIKDLTTGRQSTVALNKINKFFFL